MFCAHISEDKLRQQSIKNHLEETAELAGRFASVFGVEKWGYGCGLMHDIGKYSSQFQARLKEARLQIMRPQAPKNYI